MAHGPNDSRLAGHHHPVWWAALLAREGFYGPSAAFEGRFGFLNAYSPSPTPAISASDLGERWETLSIAVKPYPCCRYIHPALDALRAMRLTSDLAVDDVDTIEIGLPEPAMRLIAEPAEAKRNPGSVVGGQFSMPFCGAVMLSQARWDGTITGVFLRCRIQHLADRFMCVVDPEVNQLPQNFAARVTLRRGNGEQLADLIEVPKGEPENFLTDQELQEKSRGWPIR